MPGTLYIVATPIGNLEDITLRAIRTLKEVDIIAAEDTRHTQTLLKHFSINTPLTSYHEHNERARTGQLVARLERDESVALVSDAGTPGISDPGYRLVLEAIRRGIRVVPIPGPSALIAALSASGLSTAGFNFRGFLPARKRERRSKLQELRLERYSIVVYETPHRLKESLDDIREIFGDRRMVMGREITKLHEEFLRGRISEVIAEVSRREIRGEVTLIIEGCSDVDPPSEEALREEIAELVADGLRVKEIAEVLGEKYGY
ncbi:MAG TPA: 16S rRNA (cytidine(1402)-2'-O)-methyltransferase, partial [Candidatus Binatia bacterium]|nr:16S rRNA (cytidine(1402)-2'-O)-methyltransferase [Candidatus Binatia bacterium]